ncbi:HET-domain-containing protein [Cucurbitaria berberidis CBS 394.84]|uniref:HET-domain-containing protein n=1 Tax=Cucurbitaria berberidis CBS 394.84 TaxID=1168544 RepID=A0A9P4GH49_9PLEO|nr:HET-domain-containing protein [Cucurbitaria berberidis CBS 394.84]KAF1846033.1 HET-domain-containing protein [Cucurbitaria berberidis CBS 394.84]
MSTCTELCQKLNRVQLQHAQLPSHDELLAQLPPLDSDGGWCLGTWCQLQQRQQCAFCKLVVDAVLGSVKKTHDEDIDSNQAISVLVFPDEQSFRLSYPSRLGTRIAFVAENAAQARGPDTARALPGAGIDISRLNSWLQVCCDNHGACQQHQIETKDEVVVRDRNFSSSFNENATSNFRVIDVESGCIRRVALDVRYVTLSYVWGALPMLKLQKSNFETLSQDRGLDGVLKDLPNTVSDAIKLVKALGQRYLWVDGLCLVQDDLDDVVLGINMMNSIYRGSYFTIVAGSGTDANAGLPGLEHTEEDGRRVPQIIREVAPGIHMTILHGIDWHLSRSTYNERGWTLQELVLPKRTVIFINGQVYYRCQESNWSEETWAEKWIQCLDADDSNISRMPDPVDGFLPSIWAYQKLCEDFSTRNLRNDGDALRALAGVTRPMAAGMDCIMVEGLPGYYLDHFVLFVASHGDLRRRDRFASFSWAGWEGRIMWPRENFVWFNEKEDGTTERVQDTVNIFKHLRYHRIVSWKSLDATGSSEDLSFRPYELPSLLLEVIQQFPSLFHPTTSETDPLRDPQFETHRIFSHSSGSSGGVPHWDRIRTGYSFGSKWENSSVEAEQSGALPGFNIKALDLANGKSEFNRLVSRIDNIHESLALMNWMAGRHGRVRRALENRTVIGRQSLSHDDELELSSFRNSRDMSLADEKGASGWRDRRIENGRGAMERQKQENPNFSRKTVDIPAFPPYTVLDFITISLHLQTGTNTPQHNQNIKSHSHKSPFDRISGTPLLSKKGQIVGSLHPDNTHLMEPPGSTIELLLITRSHTPTVSSALFQLDKVDTNKPMKLFWVLHVIWKDGIAERRGVGQILQSALEDAFEPAPCVKPIFLG